VNERDAIIPSLQGRGGPHPNVNETSPVNKALIKSAFTYYLTYSDVSTHSTGLYYIGSSRVSVSVHLSILELRPLLVDPAIQCMCTSMWQLS
jgi:hypothetical protein